MDGYQLRWPDIGVIDDILTCCGATGASKPTDIVHAASELCPCSVTARTDILTDLSNCKSSINALHLYVPGTTALTIPSAQTWYCDTGINLSSGGNHDIRTLLDNFFSTVISRGNGTEK